MSVGARGVFNAAYEPLLFEVDTIPSLPQATSRKHSILRTPGARGLRGSAGPAL